MHTHASVTRPSSPGSRHLRVVPTAAPRSRRRRSHAPAVAALAAGIALGTLTAALVSLPFGASGAGVSLRVAAVALVVAAGALARARAVTRQTRAEWRRIDRRAASVSAPAAERLRIAA
jgi:hypothetical protein